VTAVISSIAPAWAVPGGRVRITGSGLPVLPGGPPRVQIGGHDAHVLSAGSRTIRALVPAGVDGGAAAVTIGDVPDQTVSIAVARQIVSGVHQVDGPAFDGLGRLYVTLSGSRGTQVPIPMYRVGRDGVRTAVMVDVANPTSLALGPDGHMYVSSRFEGVVYRLTPDDRAEVFASELGVPTGLAFGPDGALYVGDRSGTVFRIDRQRQVDQFATLPASVAAFHLAFGPGGHLYVSTPTLASHDCVYRITPDRLVDPVSDRFGRPQGLAFDSQGDLYVVDALAGSAGLYRMNPAAGAEPELVLTAASLVGVAFDPEGGLVLATPDGIWRLDVPLRPFGTSA
jgi:sugar lactone lactonase YvrE